MNDNRFYKWLGVFFFLILITPYIQASTQRVVVITPEKTGTHLLTKLISKLINKEVHNCWNYTLSAAELSNLIDEVEKENCFLHIHALPTSEIISTLKKRKCKVCFLMRDPRDVVVSLFHYIEKGWSIGPCGLDKPYGALSPKDKLQELITGKRYKFPAVAKIIVRRLLWMKQDSGFVYTAHFENLVGSQGGGSDKAQLQEIKSIAHHIGLKISQKRLKEIAANLWGADPGEKTTFRQGQIGGWQEIFDEEHKQAFKKLYGQLLIDLRYEKNKDW